MAGPVHSKNNQFGNSSGDHPRWDGLSPLGRRWVAEANRLGIVIDASHASDAAFDQLLELSKTPIILSHSSSRAAFDHPRNLDDGRIRRLAAKGGAICATTVFLSPMQLGPERAELFGAYERISEMSEAEQVELIRRGRKSTRPSRCGARHSTSTCRRCCTWSRLQVSTTSASGPTGTVEVVSKVCRTSLGCP
jgi:membrane dipeptidase